jgi:acyl-coenzyme A synthetase/AMP-(fatty) acid ligase
MARIGLDGIYETLFRTLKEMVEDGRRYKESGQVGWAGLPKGKMNSEVCALLCFSSGTTGPPKAVYCSKQ